MCLATHRGAVGDEGAHCRGSQLRRVPDPQLQGPIAGEDRVGAQRVIHGDVHREVLVAGDVDVQVIDGGGVRCVAARCKARARGRRYGWEGDRGQELLACRCTDC